MIINNLDKYKHKIYCNKITKKPQIILINGDCYEVVKDIKDNKIDLLFTDPPYKFKDPRKNRLSKKNVIYKKQLSQGILDLSFGFDFKLFEILKPKMKNGKINYYLFCSEKQLIDYYNYFNDKKIYSSLITWCKNVCPPFGYAAYRYNTEFLLDFREYGGYFNIKEKSINKSLYYICPPPNHKDRFHLAEKPIELLQYYLNIKSFENSIVLDCFAGSCSIAIACYNLNRKCICIEKNEDYYNKSIKRLDNLILNSLL